MLLFVVDGSGFDGNEPANTLKSLLKELRLYDKSLLKKPGLVFANKSDIKCTVCYSMWTDNTLYSTEEEFGSTRRSCSPPWNACDYRKVFFAKSQYL